MRLSWQFLDEARRELDHYVKTQDELALRQACEKGWGAVAQALMTAADRPVTSHRDLIIASELFRKTGARAILTGESAGEYLHSAGFYYGLPTAELVLNTLDLIEEFLKVLEKGAIRVSKPNGQP